LNLQSVCIFFKQKSEIYVKNSTKGGIKIVFYFTYLGLLLFQKQQLTKFI